MKGREAKGSQPADLLVCFPSRAHHLTLMQRSICSPARPSEPNKKRNHHHHLKKSSTRSGLAQGSPTPWAKTKQIDSDISEPTSPKVTCAGQIKIRQKTTKPCKSWQSVMEEIERIHNDRKQKQKRQSWNEAFGIKKEVMQFLTCLRNLRLDFRCLGALPTTSDITTEDEEEYQETEIGATESCNKIASSSGTVFSKWFMVLQENQNPGCMKDGKKGKEWSSDNELLSVAQPSVPPPNALLLMRCRSAPAKEWLKERNEKHAVKKGRHEDGDQGKQERGSLRQLRLLMEEDKREEEMKKKERLMVMKFDTDIAKETWVADPMENPLSRCRSWKR